MQHVVPSNTKVKTTWSFTTMSLWYDAEAAPVGLTTSLMSERED
jgi:hypothetical protein